MTATKLVVGSVILFTICVTSSIFASSSIKGDPCSRAVVRFDDNVCKTVVFGT